VLLEVVPHGGHNKVTASAAVALAVARSIEGKGFGHEQGYAQWDYKELSNDDKKEATG
jgi:hypothetical protein